VAEHPLDNSVWAAITGPQADLAERRGRTARYRPDVARFAALPDDPDPEDWADLALLAGPGEDVVINGAPRTPPEGWEARAGEGVQMVGTAVEVGPDPEAVLLGAADVPEMLDLVARTLVAMAGERFRPPGWSEISAVCTDPGYRGRGLASRLVRAVGAVIRERGDVPYLHAAATNTTAIRLYEHMGFTLRRHVVFAMLRTPVHLGADATSMT
jgi:ribosomal protein S18 acetylase RimI-like enzyme